MPKYAREAASGRFSVYLCMREENMDFYKIPKIELHCHLDGSMGLNVMQELLEKKGFYAELYNSQFVLSEN